MEKEYYGYNDFTKDVKILLKKLSKEYDAIVAISRGGLTFAQALSEALDIRNLQSIQTRLYEGTQKQHSIQIVDNTDLQHCKQVLIADDIADSGETLHEVVSHLKQKYPYTSFETITLFYKKSSCFEPTYWAKEAKAWIDFFWEVDFKIDTA